MSFFSALSQNVTVPAALQSTSNIDAGVTSTIGSSSTLNVVGIQWNLWATQNCIVYIDQSPDNSNWDITDQFTVYANMGASNTVQATASYVRVRIKNTGLSATTQLRFQCALCPIVEAVPRALSPDGNLKTCVCDIADSHTGKSALITPMNALKVAEAVRLVGTALFTAIDSLFWTTTPVGTGTASVTGGQTVLSTGTTSASSIRLQTVRIARYIGGASNYFRGVLRRPAVTGANNMRWGAFSATDGCFFDADNTLGFGIVTRKTGVDTRVASGSFNGHMGASYVMDTVVHTWEILWTNSSVWFFIDGELLHKVSASSTTWADTLSLPAAAENVNGANVNNNALNIRTMTISRLGQLVSQPQYAHISGAATTLLKTGPGNLHKIIFNNLPTSAATITLYDNSSATGTVIGAMSAARQSSVFTPSSVDYGGIPFSNGLTIVTTGAALDITVSFE